MTVSNVSDYKSTLISDWLGIFYFDEIQEDKRF